MAEAATVCGGNQLITQETAASDNTHLLILLSQVVMAVHYYHALQTNSVFLPPGLVRRDRTAREKMKWQTQKKKKQHNEDKNKSTNILGEKIELWTKYCGYQ